MDENTQFLTELDLCKLKLQGEKAKLIEKEIEISTLKVHVIEAQKMVLTYKSQEDAAKLNDTNKEMREYLNELSELYEIPEGKRWTYNTETGEIIVNE